jgi:hypothetical protein
MVIVTFGIDVLERNLVDIYNKFHFEDCFSCYMDYSKPHILIFYPHSLVSSFYALFHAAVKICVIISS